jgi:hypothetical protein
LFHKLFENVGAFVVETLKGRAEAGFAEALVNRFEGCFDAGCCPVLEGNGKNGVAVVVITN